MNFELPDWVFNKHPNFKLDIEKIDKNKVNDFEFYILYLLRKYRRITITVAELAKELNVSQSTVAKRIANAKDIPEYLKDDNVKQNSIRFPILEVAKFLTKTKKIVE